ncbi:MAG TPA: ABC transporter ATP-binding protein [Aestuariivirgaceae bacterium]|nr:ABC transporter ATP-binding protein [Aestuariivirgaceae bacterium]
MSTVETDIARPSAAAPAPQQAAGEDDIAVRLRAVRKTFGDIVAVRGIDLEIPAGSFVTLLGPSGCGKTTVLRMIAGLEAASGGEIWIKGRRIDEVPIHKRNVGLVFQNYALFPHKTIFDNVAFGLKYRDVPKAEIRERVGRALDIVRLPGVEKRFPAHLSGGQQQRIALARAVVVEPDVLLLDEPLSALDANLREDMRVELKRIQRDLNITTIFVTHDQAEALALSDKVVVMSDGRKEQEGDPETVYSRPASRFVAEFLGHANLLTGPIDGQGRLRLADGSLLKVADSRPSDMATVVLRAERILLAETASESEDVSVLDGIVRAVDYQGVAARYFVEVAGLTLQVINPIDAHPFRDGAAVKLQVRARDCVLLPEPTGKVD